MKKGKGEGILIFNCSACKRFLGTYRGEFFFLWDPRMVMLPCDEEARLGDTEHIVDKARVLCVKCHEAKLKEIGEFGRKGPRGC